MPMPRRRRHGWPNKRRKTAKPKPTGLAKWFYYAPTYLFRAHLGFLMGKRFLMIEHRGRKSGTLYRTVIEVAGRHPSSDEWVVASGWGPTADWYRNLKSGGFEAVWIGSRRHHATVRFLDNVEAGAVMGEYERAHPRVAHNLYRFMEVSYDGSDEGRAQMMRRIPMVAFALSD